MSCPEITLIDPEPSSPKTQESKTQEAIEREREAEGEIARQDLDLFLMVEGDCTNSQLFRFF